MNGTRAVAGRQIVGLLRATECGHWYLTTHGGERLSGALLLDPALAAATERLVDELHAVRAAALPGVLPIADLVEQDGHIWLLTDSPPGPTVRELLDAGPARGLDSGSAATLLNETAQTLLALHRADIVHGGFGPSTVVVAGEGKAALTEVALAAALGLRSVTPGDDVRDWARLAIQLAGEWSGGAAADMITRAAATADRSDLAEARQVLLGGRELLPHDFLERRPLVSAAGQWIEFMRNHARTAAVATSGLMVSNARSLLEPQPAPQAVQSMTAPGAPEPPGGAPTMPAGAMPALDPNALVHAHGGDGAPPAAVAGEDTEVTGVERGVDASARTQAGGPPPTWRDHVAPGEVGTAGAVSAGATAASAGPGAAAASAGSPPMWRDERPATRPPVVRAAHDRGPGGFHDPVPPRSSRLSWRVPLVIGVVAALLAAGLFWWQQRSDDPDALTVNGVSIRPIEGPVGCDAEVEVVGVIATNGGEGEIHYRWVRSDETGDVYRVTVPSGQTETPVTLRWTFKGSGTFDATAKLEVIEPSAASGETSFTYACE